MGKLIRYSYKYKCRYCNEVFTVALPVPQVIVDEVLTYNSLPNFLYDTHKAQDYAENPHIGLADFIGFEQVEIDRESEAYDKVDITDNCHPSICCVVADRHSS